MFEGPFASQQKHPISAKIRVAIPQRYGSSAAKFPMPPWSSDRLSEATFIGDSLAGVAATVHRLPVAALPEELHVALVRYDVIDDVGDTTTATSA